MALKSITILDVNEMEDKMQVMDKYALIVLSIKIARYRIDYRL